MVVKDETVNVRCDVCGALTEAKPGNVVYDALVRGRGQWAWLCKADFRTFGTGTGQGVGQQYTCKRVAGKEDPVWIKTKG
jgi:hypothetical protein